MKQLKLCNLICILNIYIYTCGYDTEKEMFTRHINWRKKGEGGGVSPSLETGRYGIGENYCNSFKKKNHRYQKMPVLRHTITDSKTF